MLKRCLAVLVLALLSATVAVASPVPFKCRIFDSRPSPTYTVGPIDGGEIYALSLKQPVTAQRAEPGCALPATATAAWLHITVLDPPATGYVQAWAYGQPRPFGISLAYPGLPSGGLSGGLVFVPLCVDPNGCNEDLDFLTSQTAHIVIDIQGYQ